MNTNLPAVPMPPMELSAPHHLSLLFTVIVGVLFGAALIYSVAQGRSGSWLGVACLIGGLLMSVLEPPLDTLGLLWFASDNAYIAWTTFHRFIPWYVVLGYSFFFGFQAYIAYQAALAGRPASWFWKFSALSWVLDMALQVTGAQLGLYQYYGPQAYVFFGARVWWFTIDAVLPACATLVFLSLYKEMSRPGGIWLAVPLLPAVYGGLNMALGWPVFTALNSTSSAALNWIGGTITILLALGTQRLAVDHIQQIIAERGLGTRNRAAAVAPARAQEAAGRGPGAARAVGS